MSSILTRQSMYSPCMPVVNIIDIMVSMGVKYVMNNLLAAFLSYNSER